MIGYEQLAEWIDAPCWSIFARCLCEAPMAVDPALPPAAPPAAPPSPPPSSPPQTSGTAVCGAAFLPFPDGVGVRLEEALSLRDDAADHWVDGTPCFHADAIYGGGDGACGAARLTGVAARVGLLARGSAEGWWVQGGLLRYGWDGNATALFGESGGLGAAAAAAALQPYNPGVELIGLADDDYAQYSSIACQSRCAARPGCGGFTITRGVCLLYEPLGCEPSMGTTSETSPFTYTVSGLASGCVAPSDLASEAAGAGLQGSEACPTPQCKAPLATAATRETFGRFSGDTLVAVDSGCHFKVFSPPAMLDAMRGKWMVFLGTSNTILTAALSSNLADVLPRSLLHFLRSMEDQFGLVDVVYSGRDGVYSRIYDAQHDWAYGVDGSTGFGYGNDNANEYWTEQYMVTLRGLLTAAVPAYASGEGGGDATVRVTLIVGQYWNTARQSLRQVLAAQTDTNWGSANVVVSVQVGNWYLNCIYPGSPYCSRSDLSRRSKNEVRSVFEAEFLQWVNVASEVCQAEGNACFFVTDCWTPFRQGQILEFAQAVQAAAPRWLRWIDYNRMGELRQQNVRDTHGDTFLQLQVLQMIVNTITDSRSATSLAGCAASLSADRSCFLDSVGDSCLNCDCNSFVPHSWAVGVPWMCANMRACTWRAANHEEDDGAARAGCAVDLEAEMSAVLAQGEAGRRGPHDCRGRLWCSGIGAAWGLGAAALVVWIVAAWAAACGLQGLRHRTAPSAPADATQKRAGSSGSQSGAGWLWGAKFAQSCRSDKYLHGLDMARMVASIHIVLGHLYAKGALPACGETHTSPHCVHGDNYLFGWGFTWVPWFFMLSGFVRTHARLNAAEITHLEPPLTFAHRCLGKLYPMYALGLVVATAVTVSRGRPLPYWYESAAQYALVQSWVPWLAETPLQTHCWFISCLFPYWLLFGCCYRNLVLRITTAGRAWCALALLCLLPWISFVAPAAWEESPPDWYADHHTGALRDDPGAGLSIGVATLKFNPLCYFHVFVSGMVLARLRDLAKAGRGGGASLSAALVCLRCGATLGYITLLLVFGLRDLRPESAKISARLTILMPLQMLLILGLSPLSPSRAARAAGCASTVEKGTAFSVTPRQQSEADAAHHPAVTTPPVALELSSELSSSAAALPASSQPPPPLGRRQLLSRDPLWWVFAVASPSTGDTSYCQYVLQFVAYELWPTRRLGSGTLLAFFFFLLCLSYLCAAFVVPLGARQWKALGVKRSAALALGLAVMFAAVSGADKALRSSDAVNATLTLLGSYVAIAPGAAVDVRLNWTTELENRALINPSSLWFVGADGGALVVHSARAHGLDESEGTVTCSAAMRCEGAEDGAVVSSFLSAWRSDVVLGDVRPATSLSGWDVAAWELDSGSPLHRAAIASSLDAAANHPSDGWGPLCEPRPTFVPENRTLLRKTVSGGEDPKLVALANGSIHGPFALTFSSLPPTETRPGCHQTGRSVSQMFIAADGLRISAGGAAVASRLDCGWTRIAEKNWIAFTHEGQLHYVYSVVPHVVVIARAADGACQRRYSTSASAPLSALAQAEGVRVHGSATALPYTNGTYLALFHSLLEGKYVTFAYKFAAAPPFPVVAVSRALPLPRSARSFPSGLALPPGSDKVVVSYGHDNSESRALVMSLHHLESLFDWCREAEVA